MFSRLSTRAALFAVLTTATLAYATSTPPAASALPVAKPAVMPVVQLPTVTVIGKRLAADQT